MLEIPLKIKPTNNGWMMFLPHDMFVGRSLDLYGEFSVHEQSFFNFAYRSGAAIDVGANIGAHTLFMARRFAHVYAFEPQMMLCMLLKGNLAPHLNTTVYNAAVGNDDGILHMPQLNYTAATNNFGGFGKYLDIPKDIDLQPIQLRKLDGVEAIQKEDKIDLIKIDVEGMEKEVLEGAQATISKHKPMMYVENDKPPRAEELVKFIYNLDYRAWWHITPLFNPANLYKNNENVFGNICSFNLICTPKDSQLTVSDLLECTPDNPHLPPGCVA